MTGVQTCALPISQSALYGNNARKKNGRFGGLRLLGKTHGRKQLYPKALQRAKGFFGGEYSGEYSSPQTLTAYMLREYRLRSVLASVVYVLVHSLRTRTDSSLSCSHLSRQSRWRVNIAFPCQAYVFARLCTKKYIPVAKATPSSNCSFLRRQIGRAHV